jgi:hypothetical protein
MKTKLAMMVIPVALVSLSGCGGTSDTNETKTPAAVITTKYNGSWEVAARTRAENPGDEIDGCRYGKGNGTLTVDGGHVTGSMVDQDEYAFVIDGTVDDSGKMQGKMTYEGYDAATIEGTLAPGQGGGTWKDINGCPGTWQTTKKAEGEAPAHAAGGAEDKSPAS